MPSHASFITIVVTKDNFSSLTQGIAKYQTEENEFKIVHWKYFYPYDCSYTEFSVGDIVMFTGKLIVENLEQYITVSSASVIASGDPEQVFEANKIPLSTPHCMIPIQVTCDPKELGDSTYFDATCCQYNSITSSKNVHMKLRLFYPTNSPRFTYLRANNSIKMTRSFIVSGFICHVTSEFTIIEATDVDFMPTNVSSVQNTQESSSSSSSNNCSVINLTADDIDFAVTTSQTSKRPCGMISKSSKQGSNPPPIINEPVTPIPTPTTINIGSETIKNKKGKNKLSNLALDCLEPIVMDDTQDRRTHVKDAPYDDDEDDLEFLLQQEAEENPYHDLRNDDPLFQQFRINVNANHPRAPTIVPENQHQLISNLTAFLPCQPSDPLISLNHQFQTEILYMFPCVPCSHCSILMFPAQAKWVLHDISMEYDLCRAFPHLSLTEHPNKENYIAVCTSCISIAKRHNAPTLAPIPDALVNVLMFYRRWLSSIHLSCSLSHAENANRFTHYHHLTGAFGLSKNICALQIYSGMLGAILDSTPNNNWFHPSLLYAANWLKINNRFFQQFDQMFLSIIFTHPSNVFPIAQSALARITRFSHNYQLQIDRIIHSMQHNIATIIRNQLNTLMSSPLLTSRYSILETQTDQYAAFKILTSVWRHVAPEDPDPIISTAVDYINSQEWDAVDNNRLFELG
ncbi:40768_t:CDS:2 [Gigaspora margarita]|uniref:40768_t:CDS:1 n=1 Tax=Gigaspora margarita TaxID=4874 RepID=A0ABN7UTZ9_GIGMA|nr:40768_t:CDS:2 [Gigaspora margarita]